MTIKIPKTIFGQPVSGSIETALAEEKKRRLEEKAKNADSSVQKVPVETETTLVISAPQVNSPPFIPISSRKELESYIKDNYREDLIKNKIYDKISETRYIK